MDGGGAYERLIERRIEALENNLGDVEKDVKDLRDWRNFVLGGAAAASFLIGAFAHQMVDFLRTI